MKHIYLAHPLGIEPYRDSNIGNAALWVAWISAAFHVCVHASWIILAAVWPETAEYRARGLEIDFAQISRVDELWLLGGQVTGGMLLECAEAERLGKKVIDLTVLGRSPPSLDWRSDPKVRELLQQQLGTECFA